MSGAALIWGGLLLGLGGFAFGPSIARALGFSGAARAGYRPTRAASVRGGTLDPGRELRAERTARALLRSVVSDEDAAMYDELGFLRVLEPGADGEIAYAYLIYPHRPIVAYEPDSGRLLCEYCVEFPDHGEDLYGPRLPDADDVLAKWMSLRGAERELIADANMHLPGRQVDPDQVRRDLRRLREWEARR